MKGVHRYNELVRVNEWVYDQKSVLNEICDTQCPKNTSVCIYIYVIYLFNFEEVLDYFNHDFSILV